MKKTKPAAERPCPAPYRKARRRVFELMPAIIISLMLAITPAHGVGPYAINGDTVVDQGTGLEWQKSDDATPRDWQAALAYCEKLSLHSKTGWRLPDIRELKSIVDVNRYYPAIDKSFTCQPDSYWSATPVAGSATQTAWFVFFANGDDNWDTKDKSHYVRCVHSGH